MTSLISIIVAAALVNNVVLVQALGVSSFFAYSTRIRESIELALLSGCVMFLASFTNLLLYHFILEPLSLEFLMLISFVAVSATLCSLLLQLLQGHFPFSLQRKQLAFLLISGNSAIIGASLVGTVTITNVVGYLAYSFGSALGFILVLLLFSCMRLRLDSTATPQAFRGPAIQLISAGLAAMCLLGFAGLV